MILLGLSLPDSMVVLSRLILFTTLLIILMLLRVLLISGDAMFGSVLLILLLLCSPRRVVRHSHRFILMVVSGRLSVGVRSLASLISFVLLISMILRSCLVLLVI